VRYALSGTLVLVVVLALPSCKERRARSTARVATPAEVSSTMAAPAPSAEEVARVRAHNEVVALVENGDLDGAERLLTEHHALLADFAPTENARLGILLRRARIAIDKGDLIAADRAVSHALLLAPDDTAVKTSASSVMVARARAAESRSEKRAFLDRALEIEPLNAAALVDRARIAEEESELELARSLLDRARATGASIAGVDEKMASLEKQSVVEGEFSDVRSTNFVVRFQGYANESVAWAAVRGLERAFVRVNERLSLRAPDEITVVLYSGDAYREAVGAPDWSGGIYDGKIRIKEGDLARENGRLDDVLFHEYTHALLSRALRSTLPAWVHEGIAQVMEPSFSAERSRSLVARAREQGSLLGVDTLQTTFTALPGDRARIAYAEAAVVIDRMVARQGYSGIARLFVLRDEGLTLDEAFVRVFGTDLTHFFAAALSEA
jgi:hypothetical protein